MAPKRKPNVLPAALSELKESLGGNINPKALESADPALKKRAFSALASSLKTMGGTTYQDYANGLAQDKRDPGLYNTVGCVLRFSVPS